MDLTIDELKSILELCGIININNNIVKFVKSTSVYEGNYSWSMFLLENSLSNNYFSQMSLSRYNKKYQRNINCIDLGVEGDTISIPDNYVELKYYRYDTVWIFFNDNMNK